MEISFFLPLLTAVGADRRGAPSLEIDHCLLPPFLWEASHPYVFLLSRVGKLFF